MATLAGCAALFSGYALFTAYERSDFGELAGGFWIPLLLLFVLRDRLPDAPILRRAFDGSTAPLAIVLAGAWLSNAPLGVMASYLLAAFTLAVAWARHSSAPLLRAATAAVLGLGLAAVYILPAAYEQRWVDIRQAVNDPGYQFQNSWLFARHTDPALGEHDLELLKVSAIGVTMLAIAISCLLIAWARGRFHSAARWWIPLALIPFAVLLLQFPISGPLWRVLPEFRFLQFPWRWLVVAEAPMGIFFAAAVWFTRRNWRIASLAICGAVFLVGTGAAAFSFFQDCDEEDAVAGMLNVYHAGTGFEGADEYAPRGADNSIVPVGMPAACLAASPTITLGEGPADTNPPWDRNQGTCLQTFAPAPTGQTSSAEHLAHRRQRPAGRLPDSSPPPLSRLAGPRERQHPAKPAAARRWPARRTRGPRPRSHHRGLDDYSRRAPRPGDQLPRSSAAHSPMCLRTHAKPRSVIIEMNAE